LKRVTKLEVPDLAVVRDGNVMVIAGLGEQGFRLAWIYTIRLQHSFPCLSQISPELHASLTHYSRCGQASAWLIDADRNSVQTRSNSGFSLDYTGICLHAASKKFPRENRQTSPHRDGLPLDNQGSDKW
jgi:hypothetical protein